MSELMIDEMEEYKILIRKYREIFKKGLSKISNCFRTWNSNLKR